MLFDIRMVVQYVADGKRWMPFSFVVETQHFKLLRSGENSSITISILPKVQQEPLNHIKELVDSICRDSADTQYVIIQKNLSKSQKQ